MRTVWYCSSLIHNGIVRDVHVGYSATLGEDVGRMIDELLKASPEVE